MLSYFTRNNYARATFAVLVVMAAVILVRFGRAGASDTTSTSPVLQATAANSVYTINSLTPTPVGTSVPRTTPNATEIPYSPITGVNVLTPPVTEASIRALLGNPARQGGLVHGNDISVTGVEFMTVSQAYAIVHDPFLNYFPPSEPVAYVTLTGNFVNEAPVAMHSGFAIFDVQTGNLLMTGAQPDNPGPSQRKP